MAFSWVATFKRFCWRSRFEQNVTRARMGVEFLMTLTSVFEADRQAFGWIAEGPQRSGRRRAWGRQPNLIQAVAHDGAYERPLGRAA